MERLTGSSGAPLYGMAEPLGLGPVETNAMVDYLRQRAAGAGKPMTPEVAGRLIEIAGPIPNDIQRLAYCAYEEADGAIGNDEVNQGMEEAASHSDATYADLFSGRSPGQRRVLRALAAQPRTEIFSAHFAREVQLANAASVRKAVDALAGTEFVARDGDAWKVADPFFRYWLTWIFGATACDD
jgi:hypothetical protein